MCSELFRECRCRANRLGSVTHENGDVIAGEIAETNSVKTLCSIIDCW